MRKTFRVLLMVLGGIVGGWAGYWIGHVAGWSTDADFPWTIGGGTGAILMSMGLAVLGVLLTGLWVALPPFLKARRVLEIGVQAPATILDAWSLGLGTKGLRNGRQAFEFLVEVHPAHGVPRQARVIQWIPVEMADTVHKGRDVMVRYDPARPSRVAIEIPEKATVG